MRHLSDDRETLKKYIETAIKYCVSVGLTAVHANDDAPAWQRTCAHIAVVFVVVFVVVVG